MPNTMSEYEPWSVISTSGRRSLSGLNTRSTKCRVSFAGPETTLPASPIRWSLIMLSRVTPFLRAKYFRLAGVDAADRDHEPHPVDRGDHPAAPYLRESDA